MANPIYKDFFLICLKHESLATSVGGMERGMIDFESAETTTNTFKTG